MKCRRVNDLSGPWSALGLALRAAKAWLDDGCSSLSAALAFWIALTLTPILSVVMRIAGLFGDAEAARQTLLVHTQAILGADAAAPISVMLGQIAAAGAGGDTKFSIAVALFSATATLAGFGEPIQRIWRHSEGATPGRGRLVLRQLVFRLAALAMLLVAGLALALLFVAEMLVAALAASWAEVAISGIFYWGGRRLFTLLLLTAMYWLVIKVFAPATLRWRAAGIGAAAASLLSVGSHQLLAQYLNYASLPTAHAGLSTIMLLLLWIYCSVSALLYGAELSAYWHGAMQARPRRAVLLSRSRRIR